VAEERVLLGRGLAVVAEPTRSAFRFLIRRKPRFRMKASTTQRTEMQERQASQAGR